MSLGLTKRRRPARGDDGVVLILTALALGVIFGMAALAIDVGNIGQTAQGAQGAADAAAVSGAQLLKDSSQTLSGIVTQVEQYVHDNFSAVLPSGAGDAQPAWDTCTSQPSGYAAPADSYGNAQNCITFNSGDAPGTTGAATAVNVEIPPQAVPSTFGRALGNGGPTNLTASATASLAPASSPCALCVLGGSGTTVSATGSSSLSVTSDSGGSAILVNSSGTPAVSASGDSTISAPGGSIEVVGTTSGNVAPAPTTGAGVTADPLAYLGTPTPGPVQPDPHVTGSRAVTIDPGTYPSITVDSGTLSLNPGTYVITGAFEVTGGSTALGTGVTLYFTCGTAGTPTACAAPGEAGGYLKLDGGSGFGLSAPTTGDLANVLVYYDRNDTSPMVIDGNSGFPSTGTIYARDATLTLQGSSTILTSLVDVASLRLVGGSTVSITYEADKNAGALEAALCTLEPASLANC